MNMPSAEIGETTAPKTDPNWWRGAVIYEIYPRSFQDTDGDGIGDLRGITQRLRYLADLGVDAIWVAPFFVSPMLDFGYDVSDYTAVDPMFGTIEDFDRMVAEAHAVGIKVLIDQVLSHTSDRHPWFVQSRSNRINPRADWYVWADPKEDGTPPNNWLSIFGGPAWEWDTRRQQYYFHNFLTQQPDLNFHNPEVQDAILETVDFWLQRGVDGFRLDTVNFYVHSLALQDNPPASLADRQSPEAPAVNPYNWQDHVYDKSQPENLDFLRKLRALLDRYPDRTCVGEIGDGPRSLRTMAAYTSGGDKLHMCYTFDFLSPIFTAGHFRERIAAFEAIVEDGWPCWAFSNHDVMRHATRWAAHGGAERVARLAAGILLSLRGSVCLYQGEELGLTEATLRFEELADPYGIRFWPEFAGRDGCRTPMVWEPNEPNAGFSSGARSWLPVSPEHLGKAVNPSAGNPASMLSHYRRMLAFRRAHPALRSGAIALVDAPPDMLAYIRTHEEERILCVFNLGALESRFPIPQPLVLSPLDGHGYLGHLDPEARAIDIPAGEAFFGLIA
jgi:alpha-glucosidase